MTTYYDPPAGWCYGFPLPYRPREGETLADTLRRDGYPQHEIDNGGAEHVRFWEDSDPAHRARARGVFRDAVRDWQGNYAVRNIVSAFLTDDAVNGLEAALVPDDAVFRDAGRDWASDYTALLEAARFVVEAWPQGGPRLVDAVRDLSAFLNAETESDESE